MVKKTIPHKKLSAKAKAAVASKKPIKTQTALKQGKYKASFTVTVITDYEVRVTKIATALRKDLVGMLVTDVDKHGQFAANVTGVKVSPVGEK